MKKEEQTDSHKVQQKQVGFDLEAYNILSSYKNQLINRYKGTRNVTFSDAIREMNRRIKEKNEKKE